MRLPVLALLSSASVLAAGCGLVLDLEPPPEGLDAAVRDGSAGDARAEDAPASDGCVARPEVCDGADDDCDGLVDEGIDLSSDPTSCGACGRVCPSNGGAPSCVEGRCAILCDPGRGDCDGDLANGCEGDLTDPASCGACDVVCPTNRPVCAPAGESFACVEECAAPLVVCSGLCVDPLADEAHCGGCDDACFSDPHGTVQCVDGACAVLDCGDWRADCNGDAADGCETYILSDTDCGMCGAACAPGQSCVGAVCSATP